MTRPHADLYRQLFLDKTPMLDVRAPVEYARGAFPHTRNIPLLDDDERHQVGIRYKQQGQQAAIDLGNQLVSGERREKRMQAWQDWREQHPQGWLYCFRGGLRSQTVQTWLAEAGSDVPLVPGGYKALRRFLLDSLEQQLQRTPLILLCGRTGTGKTRVIEALTNSIDLEGRAHHRGSAFGRRPAGQPAQIDFENAIAIDLLHLHAAGQNPVVVEDESKLVGRCVVPPPLQEKMKAAARVIIDEPLDSRVQVTLEDYVIGPLEEYSAFYGQEQAMDKLAEALLGALDRIRRRLGGDRHSHVHKLMLAALAAQQRDGNNELHRHWIAFLLSEYYDPMYDYGQQFRSDDVLFSGTREEVREYLKPGRR